MPKKGASPSPKRILAIDDDRIVRMSVKKILEKSGYEVIVAEDGREALELFPMSRFDLVLTDIRMPGLSGLETLKCLREAAASLEMPRPVEIVLTAYNDQHVAEEAFRMGVADFLFKPFDVPAFLKTIKKHLKA